MLNQKEIISQVSTDLTAYLNLVDQIHIAPLFSLSIHSYDFKEKAGLSSSIKDLPKNDCPVVYMISCKSTQERFHLINRYNSFNVHNRGFERNHGRINIARFNNTNSEALYIGSAMSNLKTRMKQHLGGGNDRTYALHLSKWDNSIAYNLDIQVYKIENNFSLPMERTFIEIIEQAIWEKHKPVFGKKSGL